MGLPGLQLRRDHVMAPEAAHRLVVNMANTAVKLSSIALQKWRTASVVVPRTTRVGRLSD